MKKLTLILLTLVMIVALAACGDKKCEQHVYDDCADTECNVCGNKRDSMHTWTEADCTTAKTCSVCGATEGTALGHTPAEDDGDCTTAVKCEVCDEVIIAANAEHTPEADDGDCTTPVSCTECATVVTAAKSHDHTGDLQQGETEHWLVCKNDGCTVEAGRADHDKGADGKCVDCGYRISYPYTVTLDTAYEGVKLTLTHSDGESYTFYTDEQGVANFELPKNRYNLVVEHYNSGYQWTDKNNGVTLTEENSSYQASFELLSGRIDHYVYLFNPDGTPCVYANMFIYDAKTYSVEGAFVTNHLGWGSGGWENGDYLVSIYTDDGYYALAEFKKDGPTTIYVYLEEGSAPMSEGNPVLILDLKDMPFEEEYILSLPFDNSYDFDAGESIYLLVHNANGCEINLGTDKLTLEYGGNVYTPDENNSVVIETAEEGYLMIKLTAREACTEDISLSYNG